MNVNAFTDKKSLSSDLVMYIKEKLLTGQLKPGDRIVETKMAKELGISQTPLREAIHQLVGEGIVSIVPNKGTSIREFTPKDIFEIYSLRANLESLAFKLALFNRKPQDIHHLEMCLEKMKQKVNSDSVHSLSKDTTHIHTYINQLSQHSHLIEVISSISFKVALVNSRLRGKYSKQYEWEEHAKLIKVFIEGDPIQVEQEVKSHIYRAYCVFTDAFVTEKVEDCDFWQVL
ncbi:GntR family transcriptional regulator [Cytobacillus dafuensis]|uniref:GntR family transcriptional regulator n=1 Tax=Cytobacillus dafuensis TaxID=1742359 RepID=A0A5B8Z4E8_CYTDA|nr:GntR family transcriptional regulator [Cytobacillus dafuensis]QED47935.1 GntR family transcriptional regulator [Cytobacillus dafuensis]